MGRATIIKDKVIAFIGLISIHALRGEGDQTYFCESFSIHFISIHALRGEGDKLAINKQKLFALFQSTPSVGRATQHNLKFVKRWHISIHALRGEGDFL